MKRELGIIALAAACGLLGCKDKGKTESASQPAGTPAAAKAGSTPSGATPQTSGAAAGNVAPTAQWLAGTWKQSDGDGKGTEVSFKSDGTFTSDVMTGWKKKGDPTELGMIGKWKLQGAEIHFTNILVGPPKSDMARVVKLEQEHEARLKHRGNATTQPTTEPTTLPAERGDGEADAIKAVGDVRFYMRDHGFSETDKIVSASEKEFKSLDEDGKTRSYQREGK